MNIIFAGTPEFAATILQGLLDNHVKIAACYSQPDRPLGRGQKLVPTKVKEVALNNKIPVYQPENFKSDESIDTLSSLLPDLIIVVAYGLILPQKVLDIPTHGAINVHGSILPKWRGASPVQYAILNGDKETGVSIMQLDKGMDTGDIIEIITCKIAEFDTTETLLEKLAAIGINAILETLTKLQNKTLTRSKQNHNLATYAPKINKADALITWNESTETLLRKIRAFNPWPICYFTVNEINIKIIEVSKDHILLDLMTQSQATSAPTSAVSSGSIQHIAPGKITAIDKHGIFIKTIDGTLVITKVQFPGSKLLSAVDVKNSPRYLDILKPLF